MDLDERAVKIFAEAEALSETDLRGALAKMREAFAIEPDYPNLEDEIFIREDAISKLDGLLKFIVVLLREGKDYQACQMLQGLPANYIIQDKSGLVGDLEGKITIVEGLVEHAKELAGRDCVQALSVFEEALELVADYPKLAADVTALRKDVARYKSFVSAIEKALRGKDSETASNFLVNFETVYPDDENISRFKVLIVNLDKALKKKKAKKINLLLILAAVWAVLGAGASYFGYEMVMFKKAGRQWLEVNRLLAAQEFSETQAACLTINQNLGRVRLFFLTGKQELQDKVDEVLQSELVVQGAAGKVLFDGDYIPKEQLANSRELKKSIEKARGLVAAGDYAAAIREFEDALVTTSGMDAKTSAQVIDDIKLSISRCRLNIISELAAKAGALLGTGAHYAANALISEAVAMVTEHAIDVSEPVVIKALAVKKDITLAGLKELRASGDKRYVAGNYESAIEAYNKTLAFADANKLGSESLRRQIYGMIRKSKVNGLVSRGDRYLTSGKWQDAVRAYESGLALALQDDLQSLPSFRQAQLNLQKAKKMRLLASLEGQNKLARQYAKANKRLKSRDVFKQALKSGAGSDWRGDRQVAAVLGELKSGLAELEEKIFVAAKKQFLRDRYASILKKDFGLGADAGLLDPEVVLLAASPELLKFSLTAMSYAKSGTRGKYSRYEATYGFDRARETWRLLHKSSGSKVSEDLGYH